jgi:hypothetical protein
MKASIRLVALLVILTAAFAHAQGVGDHLKCEKIRDPLKVNVQADLVEQFHPELSAAGCSISHPKLFCSPANKTNVNPPPPNPQIVGQQLTNDYVCYKARCPVHRTTREVSDQFGTRDQQQVSTSLVCVPAGCVPTTCAAQGANCGSVADGCGGTLSCGDCIQPDTCGGGGLPNVCGTPTSDPCGTTPPPPAEPLGSTCRLAFPPAASIGCPISEPGTPYFVNATTGSDANDGRRPDRAWATLCRAVQAAPSGSTLRVAGGVYTTAALTINRPLTVKGGYDATFTDWDPDRHPTVFTGALTLEHDEAVFGGFRMISRPVGQLGGSHWADWHHIEAGTLIRNYVEVVYQASVDQYWLYAILASAPAGRTSRIACNDIYIRGREGDGGFLLVDGIEYGNLAGHLGTAEVSANRICLDGPYSGWADTVIRGYGTCGSTPASITVTNNILESAVTGAIGSAAEFYGCNRADLGLVFSNNTILSASDGLTGYQGDGTTGVVRWTLANNILFSTTNSGTAINVGSGKVEISSSIGNLVFGFTDNGMHPAPLFTMGDDTRGGFSVSQIFMDGAHGDFRLLAAGPGVGTGVNVYGQAAYGSVMVDLAQNPRPISGPWDRGALEE